MVGVRRIFFVFCLYVTPLPLAFIDISLGERNAIKSIQLSALQRRWPPKVSLEQSRDSAEGRPDRIGYKCGGICRKKESGFPSAASSCPPSSSLFLASLLSIPAFLSPAVRSFDHQTRNDALSSGCKKGKEEFHLPFCLPACHAHDRGPTQSRTWPKEETLTRRENIMLVFFFLPSLFSPTDDATTA